MRYFSIRGSLIFLCVALVTTAARADHGQSRSWTIASSNVTGPNDYCDKPIWELPAPLPPMAHFTLLGEFNTTAGSSIANPLTSVNCNDSTLLATTIDPEFQAFFSFPDPDSRITNLPLHQVPIIASLDGTRSSLEPSGTFPTVPLPPTRSEPNDAITLGDWFKAFGRLHIRCSEQDSARVFAQFGGLIPNGIYTLFGIWLTTPPSAPGPTFLPVAFGGFPNVMVASPRGRASFERELSYCPKGTQVDGSILMFVDLAYHSDGTTHGAFPFRPLGNVQIIDIDGQQFETSLPPGTTTHVQLGFPINVEPLQALH